MVLVNVKHMKADPYIDEGGAELPSDTVPVIDPFTSPPEVAYSAKQVWVSSFQAGKFKSGLLRVKHLVGLDRSIAWTVAGRGWASVSGLISVLLVAHFLSPVEQGFYYTFGSVVAAQVFFELGLTSVLLHTASHEGGYLHWENGVLVGEEVALGRLSTLFQRALIWYAVAAILVVLCLVPGGFYFFLRHQGTNTSLHWRSPWIILVFGTAANLLLSPAVTLFEGVGLVSQVAALRFRQTLLSSFILWTTLLFRKGLLAAAVGVCTQAVVVAVWLGLQKRHAILSLLRHRPQPHACISWGKEVWPFQWRIAISWLSGYFIFQAFNPILFAYCGPVEAGRMGMSMTICTAISVLGLSWVNTKAAPFGQWIARKDYALLDKVFFRALLQSSILVCTIYFIFGATIFWAQSRGNHLSLRVLPIGALSMILVASTLNHFVNAQAIYLRSHKREVLMPSAILGGVATLLLTKSLAPRYGSLGVSAGYLLSSTVFGFFLVSYIFIRSRKTWHT
jgi:hypothetical protein